MDIILYNPLSRNGKSNKFVLRVQKKLSQDGTNVKIQNLLEIVDIKDFIDSANKKDRFIIVGGDGTINNIANQIKDLEFEQEIYLLKAGTGNDFARSIKAKKNLVPIKKYLYNLPTIKFKDEENVILNGAGLGLDGMIAHKVNESSKTKSRKNYFINSLKSFINYKPFKSEVIVNGEKITTEKTWSIAAMNSKYLGGGMKIAPKAKRTENDLDIVIIRKLPKFLLFLIFPTIYLGLHVIFKRYVKIIKTNEATIKISTPTYLQIDGEDYSNITEMHVSTQSKDD